MSRNLGVLFVMSQKCIYTWQFAELDCSFVSAGFPSG